MTISIAGGMQLDIMAIHIIDLPHLKANKRAAGRLKDLADLENLPWSFFN